jgi:hypothetical protein
MAFLGNSRLMFQVPSSRVPSFRVQLGTLELGTLELGTPEVRMSAGGGLAKRT